MPVIDVFDIGDEVICDFCNAGFEDDSAEGGCFIGTYAICPECTRTRGIKSTPEEPVDFIKGSFRQAVLKSRNGDNTIKFWVE